MTIPWDIQELLKPPRTYPADGFEETGGIRPIFYEGLPWRGGATRVFAWLGTPENVESTVPAMVLIHGGGGTAFRDWVELWIRLGYAAISMDTCGAIPRGTYNNWERHGYGGPPGWGGFNQIDSPVEDQWTYHAVADVVLAHSLLASQPGVDPGRIGLTGISWGGYLSCIVASIDSRFRFNVPVYGCGHIELCPAWSRAFTKMGPDRSAKWRRLWDPSSYLPLSNMPFLWVTGTNDQAYPLDALQGSYRMTGGPSTLAIRPRMPHGHGGPGEKPEEIRVFANHLLRGGPALPRIYDQEICGNDIQASYSSDVEITSVELHYTLDSGIWVEREWRSLPGELKSGTCTAGIPEGTTVCFLNLVDDDGLVASSEHVVL